MPSSNARSSDRDGEDIARRTARDEVKRIAWKVVSLVLGLSFVSVSVGVLTEPVGPGPRTPLSVAFTLVGVNLFSVGVYCLATTVNLDRALLRWANRHT